MTSSITKTGQWVIGVIPISVQESLNQKSGSVKTFPVPELVYMEVFVTFDQELKSARAVKQSNIQTSNLII